MDRGASSFDVTQEAEDRWRSTMREKAPPIHEFLAECTPGYLNNEGNVDDSALRLTIYGGGSIEYANLLKAWRDGDGVERDLALAGVREPAGESDRSEERRGGKEGVSTCRSRWSP